MTALDTGICVPESIETLYLQQRQLVRGQRDVQMFPIGTLEIVKPEGFSRHENFRGIFHFRPDAISAAKIDALSTCGRENEFLKLGPFSKCDVARRVMNGEQLTCIMEYSPTGVELRCAAGSSGTIAEQQKYFEATKEHGNIIIIGELPERVRLAKLA